MVTIDSEFYLERKTNGGKGTKRNWWLVKTQLSGVNSYTGAVDFGAIHLPKEFIGKRVRFKMEIVEG